MLGFTTLQILSDFSWNDKLWIIIGAVFMLLGLSGCFVKKIPGVPFALLGLMILQLMENAPFYVYEILILLAITIVIMILDYQAPVIGEKLFKSQKTGVLISNIIKLSIVAYMIYRFVIAIKAY